MSSQLGSLRHACQIEQRQEQTHGHRSDQQTHDDQDDRFDDARQRPEGDFIFFVQKVGQVKQQWADLAALFAGRQVADGTRCYLTTNRMVYADAAASGYTLPIERAGAVILQGVCFYLLVPQELAADHGYRTLVTNSAKLANILGGYGYSPSFRPTEVCVEAAVTGRLPW